MSGRRIWQQAAGDTDRDYAELCLEWDVILNGPGYAGDWTQGGEQRLKEHGWTSRKISDLRRFAETIAEGDIVVLRTGTTDVWGVGEVVGKYQWSDAFGDVDGWNLQHVRRVRWLWDCRGSPKIFPTYSLKFGDTTQTLNKGPVRDWLDELDIPQFSYDRELCSLPAQNESNFKISDLSEFLFDRGVASGSIEALTSEIGELTRIAKWYTKSNEHSPSEPETIAYLIVPLLRALGWTPQKMAIEWNHVDIALFSKLPRKDDHLAVVVEAKKKGRSCLTAVSQAKSYADSRSSCSRLIVTDGIRFGVHIRQESDFKLHAYMNLTQLRNSYAIYRCHGVKEAMQAMTPEWYAT